jgi:IgGFc binding protein
MRIDFLHRNTVLGAAVAAAGAAAIFAACTDSYQPAHLGSGGSSSSTASSTSGMGGLTLSDAAPCNDTCSNDLMNVVDCKGTVVTACTVNQGCANGVCIDNPCQAAELSKSSYGCDYWALKTAQRPQADGACFAAFVANTWGKPVHLTVTYGGQVLPVASFTAVPTGQGQAITYQPYDATAGLAVGQVAVIFLSRNNKGGSVVACPMGMSGVSAETGVDGTGLGSAFHITSDYPVVAYQMDPYGGGQAGVTSATLLLPTSAWDTNYIAVNAYASAETDGYTGGLPSLDILAQVDNTQVTILPKVDIVAGTGVAAATAGMPATYTLSAGQFLQITQTAELTGSPIQSTQPIAVFGASAGMAVPLGQADIDSAQQQLPPVRALGNEYVAVRYRSRGAADGGTTDESVPWRLVGAVDGTTLTWEPSTPAGAPTTLNLGDTAQFSTPGPFVVTSQDTAHPFYLGGYMTGGGLPGGLPFNGEGDPDWVNVIAPLQYLNHYVLFTDPSYSETNLVLVRSPSLVDGKFADVTLNCAGATAPQTVTGWQPIGAYEYTRVDLVTGAFTSVGGCSNGRQEILSALPFGVTVWGWGTVAEQTQNVSYAYPAGAGFQPINAVVVPPTPK